MIVHAEKAAVERTRRITSLANLSAIWSYTVGIGFRFWRPKHKALTLSMPVSASGRTPSETEQIGQMT